MSIFCRHCSDFAIFLPKLYVDKAALTHNTEDRVLNGFDEKAIVNRRKKERMFYSYNFQQWPH